MGGTLLGLAFLVVRGFSELVSLSEVLGLGWREAQAPGGENTRGR